MIMAICTLCCPAYRSILEDLARRGSPRFPVETLCMEYSGDALQHSLAVDLSGDGLRLIRPFFGGAIERIVQLELELPGIDEILWAKGEVCFDEIRRTPRGIIRSSGIKLAAAATRDLGLLRDWVREQWRARESMDDCLHFASAYTRG
jgi:hypothetical protein